MDFSKMTRIYIFGAHSRARTLAIYLQKLYQNIEIEAFLVDNEEVNPDNVNRIPVIKIKKNRNENMWTDLPVFIGTKGVFHGRIEKVLKTQGFNEIYPVTVEMDLQLRNAFFRYYFREQGRKFEKIDSYDICIGRKRENENSQKDIEVYVVRSVYDQALKKPYRLEAYEKEIQVGAALTMERLADDICVDNVGENISEKNKQYCELTALYWMWKNANKEILGLVHYRRHFILPGNWYDIMLKGNIDVILPVPLYVDPNLEENYRKRHDGTDLDYLFEFIRQKDGTEYRKVREFWSRGIYSPCNMFIMKKNVLNELCEWLFPILEEVVYHGKQKEDAYQNRYPGFLAERLISYFFENNRDIYKVIYADKNFLQ